MNLSAHRMSACKKRLPRLWFSILIISVIPLLVLAQGLQAATPPAAQPAGGSSAQATDIAADAQPVRVRAEEGAVHDQPDPDSEILKKLRRGDLISRLFRSGEWYAVKLSDHRLGWVHQNAFAESDVALASQASTNRDYVRKYVKVMVRTARVRASDSFQGTIAFRLAKHTRVAVMDIRGDWYLIQTPDGERGWLHQIFVADVEPLSSDTASTDGAAHQLRYVKVSEGAVYERPTIEAKILALLSQGQPVELLDTEREWHLVKTGSGQTGWMHSRVLQTTPPALSGQAAEASSGAAKDMIQVAVNVGRIRTAPDLKASILARLDKGTPVERVARQRDWYQVRLADQRLGWGHRILFKEISAAATKPQPNSFSLPTSGTTAPRSPRIETLRFEKGHPAGTEQMVVAFSGDAITPPEIALFEKPTARVVCDFRDMQLNDGVPSELAAHGQFVQRIRTVPHATSATHVQVVLDLQSDAPHEIQQFFYPRNKQFRLVFLPVQSGIKVE